jgi:DNA repair and recombination protein RAD52
MKFDDKQIVALSAPLLRENVKVREQAGRELSYIESWMAIKEANNIFGFDGWSRETVELRMVSERARKIGKAQDDGWSVSYVGRVRITVGDIVREGVGAGHGIDRDLGLAHESAIKECESDSAKRALMTFGNPFGLALYDKEQNEVEDAPKPQPAPPSKPTSTETPDPNKWAQKAITNILGAKTRGELDAFLKKHDDTIVKYRVPFPAIHGEIIKAIQHRTAELG